MPTKYLVRTWCKTCKDWTKHDDFKLAENRKGLQCLTCKTTFEGLNLSEIPEEKIQEQRTRYSKGKSDGIESRFANFGKPKSTFFNLLTEEWPEPIILEDDAGQKELDAIAIKESWKRIGEEAEKKRLFDIERKRYTDLGRNDACACGSGVKYKKCCLSK